MRNENEEQDHNAALTEVVTESALVPASVAPHDGVSDERRIFTAGWSAGFQEALEPDRYPDRDRCEDAFREWTLLRADALASPPTTVALPNSETEQCENSLYSAIKALIANPSDAQLAWSNIDDAVLNLEAAVRSDRNWNGPSVVNRYATKLREMAALLREAGIESDTADALEAGARALSEEGWPMPSPSPC
jgi:hypothetical protein